MHRAMMSNMRITGQLDLSGTVIVLFVLSACAIVLFMTKTSAAHLVPRKHLL